MGLFDRFRKRIHEVADETDSEALSVNADSEEGKAYLSSTHVEPPPEEDDWDDVVDVEADHGVEAPPAVVNEDEDDWDTWE